jgi:threonyl-tRNA synthetase
MDQFSQEQIDQETMRHSLAHILAMALLRLYPNAKLGIGPAIENGFYYDVDTGTKLLFKDLEKLEKEMHKIIAENVPFKQVLLPKDQAFEMLLQSGQIYKSELLQQVPDQEVSFFKTGDFFDLCRGPHIASSGKAGFFKLIKISPVHWLGQKSRPRMQRIEGVGFKTKQQLTEYLNYQKELSQRDYRKLGNKLKLLTFSEELGNNLMIWLPKGNIIKEELKKHFIDMFKDLGFEYITTPSLSKFTLFREYFENDQAKKEYLPLIKTDRNEYLFRKDSFYQHGVVYKSLRRSYKHLPIRFCEFLETYYQNPSENYADLTNTQSIQSHIYCTAGQIITELELCLQIVQDLFKFLNIKSYQLIAKVPNPKDNSKTAAEANLAVEFMQKALSNQRLVAKIATGQYYNEGAEIGFLMKNIYGNLVNISNIKLDLITPQKEKLSFINKSNHPETPAVIRFNLIESFDNLMKILIEYSFGVFPVWMAPVQTIIIPISQKYNEPAQEVYKTLIKSGLRVQINTKDEPMQAKIRSAESENIPYMLILGEKELKTSSVSIRQRNGQELGLIRVEEFTERIRNEIAQKGF